MQIVPRLEFCSPLCSEHQAAFAFHGLHRQVIDPMPSAVAAQKADPQSEKAAHTGISHYISNSVIEMQVSKLKTLSSVYSYIVKKKP